MNETQLRAALHAPSPADRFAASYVVGERRLFWTDELISLLNDKNAAVRQAARRSLMILAFLTINRSNLSVLDSRTARIDPKRFNAPVDFGPSPKANREAQCVAAERWAAWWREQQTGGSLRTLATKAVATEGDAARLATQLLQSTGARREQLLKEYEEKRGVRFTEALVCAIQQLSGGERSAARQALRARLGRMTTESLDRYLDDEEGEIRRAAALALATKESKAHVSHIIELLRDSLPAVRNAAKAALQSLSGQDFGPRLNPTEEEVTDSIERWQAWARGQQRPSGEK